MVHKRSEKAMHKRLARRIISATSFHDRELAETIARVNLTYTDKIENHVFTVNVERGEVLHDSRGRGTTEQIILPQKPRR